MPYYCTVPRCTSMAGKAKNVSFHQFPRDEELAKLWNRILKRGKPYTKYSKVCSLHFKPEDYTITSVGKNKGQWRTLRKDAIPTQNLPSDSPVQYQRSQQTMWAHGNASPSIIDPRLQQQMAQAIYMQTMLAMQASGTTDMSMHATEPQSSDLNLPTPHTSTLPNLDTITQINNDIDKNGSVNRNDNELSNKDNVSSFKCDQCSKYFKDPDVYILHKRTHMKNEKRDIVEKENYHSNNDKMRQETLRANPILANLLKSGLSVDERNNSIDSNTILSIENQIMTALAANMESYIRNLSTLFTPNNSDNINEYDNDNKSDSDDNHELIDSKSEGCDLIDNRGDGVDNVSDSNEDTQDSVERSDLIEDRLDSTVRCDSNVGNSVARLNSDDRQDLIVRQHSIARHNSIDDKSITKNEFNLEGKATESSQHCDNVDLNDSIDSNNLVIDETI